MRASPTGVLAVTIWNKEEPPKSGAEALRHHGGGLARPRRRPHGRLVLRRLVLSLDATVLYKRVASPPTRSPRYASTRAICRSTRSIRGFLLRRLADRPHLDGYVAQFFSTPVNGPPVRRPRPTSIRPRRPMTGRRRARRAAGRGRRRGAAFDRHGPLACIRWSTAAGRDRQAIRLQYA